MMVPRGPLLWAVGLWVVPLNLLAAVFPGRAGACLAAMLPVLGAALWDAWRLRGSLDGLEPDPAPADPARFTLGKPGILALSLRGRVASARKVRVLVDLPLLLTPSPAALDLRLPPGESRREFPVSVTPVLRGRAAVRGYTLETASPLKLWSLRRSGPMPREIRVYPGLSGGTGKVSLPETLSPAGQHHRRQAGKGREFDKLREYLHGDDYHDIHWKATAKRGFPVTKTFQVENTQQVYAILDASRMSSVPLVPAGEAPLPAEYYLRTALRLGMAAERQGDRYGLMLYADRPLAFLRAAKGESHYGRFRDALCALETRPEGPDYAELFTSIRLRLRKRAMLIFLCSLDEPALAESFAEHIALISRQHLVSVVSVKPPGLHPVFQGAPVSRDAEVYARLADQIRLRRLDRLAKDLRRQGATFKAWEPDRLSAEAVARYLDAKNRRVVA
ncbi:MAG TPA: DUF58 domain-containing protein [Fibrobacteria bacterium]|nr:DUF58 domain-containing protein [Fibrobacteria bacterium]